MRVEVAIEREEGGVDGSRALRWANGDPAYYAMPSQCPPLAAGRPFQFRQMS